MLPTRRGVLQVVLACVLYAAGANVGAGWVVVLAAALAGAVLSALACVWWAARRVRVLRALPTLALAGSPVQVTLEAHAPGMGRIVVADSLTGLAGAVDPGRRLTAAFVPRRGAVGGGDVRVELTDPLGLARATLSGQVASPLLAVPAIPPSETVALPALAEGSLDQAARARSGPEFAGLRAYAPGDPPRSVQWRATARHGRMVVGEPTRPTAPALRVALAGGAWTQEQLDRAIERVCGLAAAAAAMGRPTEVAADGSVRPWTEAARRDLTLLPPHAGAPARTLAPPPSGAVETITVGPE